MKSENWQSGQKVLKQDVVQAETAPENAIKDRQADNFSAGIASDLLNGMAFLVGNTSTSLTIDTGIGYDSNGERILIDSKVIPYADTNLTKTTPNGVGSNILTPQSSGSNSIELTSGVVNLLYIQYVNVIDPLTFSIHKITKAKLFTRVNDGYEIRVVNGGNVDPLTINLTTSVPGDGGPWIFLGWVDYRVGGSVSSSMFSTTFRPLYQININRVEGVTPKQDLSNVTPSQNYGFDQAVDFDAHVKAIGSTAPTNRNPHGTTLQDIGFNGKTTEQHEEFLHTAGIANGDQTANIGNSLNLKVNPRCPDLDEIVIYGLASAQYLVIPNTADTAAVTLSSIDLTTVTFKFTGKSTATYYFWANSLTRLVEVGTSAPGPTEYNKFLLWTVDFSTTKAATNISSDHFIIPPSGPCAGVSNFTNLIDGRIFGNTGSANLAVDSATDTFTINHNVDIEKDLDVDGNFSVQKTLTANVISALANALKLNLKVFSTSDAAQTITADILSIQGVSLSSVSTSINTSVSGVGGLDTGVVTNSTWYAVFVITNDTGSSVNGLFSLSTSAPTLPGGYTKFRRVGWIKINAAGHILWTHRRTDDVLYADPSVNLTSGVSTGMSFATWVPPTSRYMEGNFSTAIGAPGGAAISARFTGQTNYYNIGQGYDEWAGIAWILLDGSQTVDLQGSGSTSVNVIGYRDEV